MKKSWISVALSTVVGTLGMFPAWASHLSVETDPTLQNMDAAQDNFGGKPELQVEPGPQPAMDAAQGNLGSKPELQVEPGPQPADAASSAKSGSTQPEEPASQLPLSQKPSVQENTDSFYKSSDGRASVLTNEQYRELVEIAKTWSKGFFKPSSAEQKEEIRVWLIKVLQYYGAVHGVTLTVDDPALQAILFTTLLDETEDEQKFFNSIEEALDEGPSQKVVEPAENSLQETTETQLDKTR